MIYSTCAAKAREGLTVGATNSSPRSTGCTGKGKEFLHPYPCPIWTFSGSRNVHNTTKKKEASSLHSTLHRAVAVSQTIPFCYTPVSQQTMPTARRQRDRSNASPSGPQDNPPHKSCRIVVAFLMHMWRGGGPRSVDISPHSAFINLFLLLFYISNCQNIEFQCNRCSAAADRPTGPPAA